MLFSGNFSKKEPTMSEEERLYWCNIGITTGFGIVSRHASNLISSDFRWGIKSSVTLDTLPMVLSSNCGLKAIMLTVLKYTTRRSIIYGPPLMSTSTFAVTSNFWNCDHTTFHAIGRRFNWKFVSHDHLFRLRSTLKINSNRLKHDLFLYRWLNFHYTTIIE